MNTSMSPLESPPCISSLGQGGPSFESKPQSKSNRIDVQRYTVKDAVIQVAKDEKMGQKPNMPTRCSLKELVYSQYTKSEIWVDAH